MYANSLQPTSADSFHPSAVAAPETQALLYHRRAHPANAVITCMHGQWLVKHSAAHASHGQLTINLITPSILLSRVMAIIHSDACRQCSRAPLPNLRMQTAQTSSCTGVWIFGEILRCQLLCSRKMPALAQSMAAAALITAHDISQVANVN